MIDRRGNAVVAEKILLLAPGLFELALAPNFVEALFVANK